MSESRDHRTRRLAFERAQEELARLERVRDGRGTVPVGIDERIEARRAALADLGRGLQQGLFHSGGDDDERSGTDGR